MNTRRITALTPHLWRLQWAADGQFDDRPSFIAHEQRPKGLPLATSQEGEWMRHQCGAVSLRSRGDGPWTADTVQALFPLGSGHGQWHPGLSPRASLGGTTRTLDGTAGDPPLEPGLLSLDGWALLDDSGTVRFDGSGWVSPGSGDQQDWYLFLHGHDFRAALADFMCISGRPPLPPRGVLGLWWSRYWPYSDQEYRDLVGEFREHGYPLDVLVMDMDWHQSKDWTGYTWNRSLFPDPQAFLAWCHEQGLMTTLNLHPAGGVQNFEEQYAAFAAALGHPGDGSAVPFRVSDSRYMGEYFRQLHRPHEDAGVDFWWMDWQQGTTSEMPDLDPLPWLNHLHHRDLDRGDRRGVLLSRWGGMGGHRYPIQFSGDTHSKWETLASQVDFTANGVASLAGWWSHDIGGHLQPPTPELFARWFQWGAWSPTLRLHAGRQATQERRPWAFGPEVDAACRLAADMRLRYFPLWIAAAHAFARTGVAPLRPLWFDNPTDAQAQAARSQALLGDQILIAPMVSPMQDGVAKRLVVLPEGEWWDMQRGELHQAGIIQVSGDLNRLPVFVRRGAVLGIAPYQRSGIAALDPSRMDVELWPGDGQGEIIEDAGQGDGWQRGEMARTLVSQCWMDDQCLITCGPTVGAFPGLPAQRPWTITIPCCSQPQTVELWRSGEQQTVDWQWTDGVLQVSIAAMPRQRVWGLRIGGIAMQAADSAGALPEPRTTISPRFDRQQAQLRLADAILLPPAAGARAQVRWRLEQGQVWEEVQDSGWLTSPAVMPCPLAWIPERGAAQWQATVQWVDADGAAIASHQDANPWPLFCGVAGWLVSVSTAPLPAAAALDPQQLPATATPWKAHDYRQIRHESLLDGPYLWCDSDLAVLLGVGTGVGQFLPDGTVKTIDAGEVGARHVAGLSELVVHEPVRLRLRAKSLSAGISLSLNGRALALDEKGFTPVVDLASGSHRLCVVLHEVEVAKAVRYMRLLSIIPFQPAGGPLTGIGDRMPEEYTGNTR